MIRCASPVHYFLPEPKDGDACYCGEVTVPEGEGYYDTSGNSRMNMQNLVPQFANDYPDCATELKHLSLPFYCINCQRKADTRYATDNLGPFCATCWKELVKWRDGE